jgi:hypothetical protein
MSTNESEGEAVPRPCSDAVEAPNQDPRSEHTDQNADDCASEGAPAETRTSLCAEVETISDPTAE